MPDPVSLETHSRESFEVSAVIARERERLRTRPRRGGEGVQECRFHTLSDNEIREMPTEEGIPAILFPPMGLG